MENYYILWETAIVAQTTDSNMWNVGDDIIGTDGFLYRIDDSEIEYGYKYAIRRFKYYVGVGSGLFNGSLDSNITLMDSLKMIGKSGRFLTYLDGALIKLRADIAQPVRTALFNETNMLKNTLKIDYLFGADDDNDGVLVKYREPLKFKEAIEKFPIDCINPEVMELIGCTEQSLALSEATYGWKQKEARRKVVTFSSDNQALIPQYLDRIGIVHYTPKWGSSGFITDFSGDEVTLDCDFDIEEVVALDCVALAFPDCSEIAFPKCESYNKYNKIIFTDEFGAVHGSYDIEIVSSRVIRLLEPIDFTLKVDEIFDNTVFSLGYEDEFVRDYLVTKVVPKSENNVQITAINYDESIYS